MLLAKFDLFSQPFLFNLNNNQFKKGTIQGVILSLGILGTILAYFTYLTFQFFNNKIDPIFRSQTFVTNELVEVPLHEDLVAFKFIESPTQSLEQFEKKMNLTYIVPIATFGYESPSGYNTTYLNITKCSNPELESYSCLDFSTLANNSLINSSKQKIFSVITILFYSCSVTDDIKTFVPDNCANQTAVDDFANGAYTLLHLRLFTQQYNTTSKQNQVNFKNYMMFPQSGQYTLNTQNIQNQITKVRDGFIIQQESEYIAPISKFANKSILQDFFCVFLQSMHQSLYEEVLKQNKLYEQNTQNTQIETQQNQLGIGQEITEREALNSLNIPKFITKSREYIEQSQQNQINTTMQNEIDEVIQSEEDRMQSSPDKQKDSQQFEFEQNATIQNKLIKTQQINEDSKFDNNLLTSVRNEVKNSSEQSYLFDYNITCRTQSSPLRKSSFLIRNQKSQKNNNNIPAANIFQQLKIENSNPIKNEEINPIISQSIQNSQQSQLKSCMQEDSIKLNTEQTKMSEQLKKKLNTLKNKHNIKSYLKMLFSKFDLFSQPFLFNVNNNQLKKGTPQGFIMSLFILGIVLIYFVYLTMQFFNNKIDPIFRSQSFVTNELIEIPLHEDLVAFQFIESPKLTLDQFEKKMNLTYIVPIATFGFQSLAGYNTTYLNFTECSNPELQGYKCLDFSTLANKSLIQSSRDKAFSVLTILFYSCSVTDNIKTFVPNNCANQTDIDDFVNGAYTLLHLRLFTQQYNTTSKQNQVNFKNYMMFPQSDQYFLNTQKTQNQITKVRDGFVIQSETEYTAPIQYVQENQSFPNNQNPYIQVNIQIDEVIQYTSIQFSTFPQILALVNSTFSLLILLGFFCRKFANKSILQDFFCIFLQNMHQNLYEEVLKQNKLFEQKSLSTEIEIKSNKFIPGQEISEKDAVNSINIPQFITKSREYIEQSQQIQFNATLQNYQDEVIQPTEEQKSTNEDQSPIQKNDQMQNQAEQPNKLIQKNTEENQLNNILLTSSSNENKNFNDSYLNILKKSPKSQLNLFKSNFSQTKVLATKPSQSLNNFKKIERKKSSFILQKDIALCFSQNIQQPINNQQGQSKLLDSQVPNQQDNQINQTKQKRSSIIEYYVQKFKTIQDLSVFKKFTQINFGYKFSIQKRLNIFKKENKEDEKKNHRPKQEIGKQEKKSTYFEQQLDILDSTDLSCKYIKKFIDKCNNNKTLDKIDKRILSSINKNSTN
ncbi:hypothetical protein ABPG74_005366 [Tetrahymena malaccensis]